MVERIRVPRQDPLDAPDPTIKREAAKLEKEARNGRYGDSFGLTRLLEEPTTNYQALITNQATSFPTWSDDELHKPYSKIWTARYFTPLKRESSKFADGEIEKMFEEKLPGSILVDIGGAVGNISYVAAEFSTGLYINVDLFPKGRADVRPLNSAEDITDEKERYLGKTRKMSVRADMLDFISRLPSGSVNVTINGIDVHILRDDEEYATALATEILRVLKPGGILFGYSSAPLAVIEEWIRTKDARVAHLSIYRDKFRNNAVVIKKEAGSGASVHSE